MFKGSFTHAFDDRVNDFMDSNNSKTHNLNKEPGDYDVLTSKSSTSARSTNILNLSEKDNSNEYKSNFNDFSNHSLLTEPKF